MTEFKKGDIVQLKSGGPPMTIDSINSHAGGVAYTCVWSVNDLINYNTFDGETLKLYILTTENDDEDG